MTTLSSEAERLAELLSADPTESPVSIEAAALIRRIPELEADLQTALGQVRYLMKDQEAKVLERDQLRAELEGRWLPIESAPKDGTKFLVIHSGRIDIGWFGKEGKLYLSTSIDEYGLRPVCHGGMYGRVATHWRPLPPPPTTQEGDK